LLFSSFSGKFPIDLHFPSVFTNLFRKFPSKGYKLKLFCKIKTIVNEPFCEQSEQKGSEVIKCLEK